MTFSCIRPLHQKGRTCRGRGWFPESPFGGDFRSLPAKDPFEKRSRRVTLPTRQCTGWLYSEMVHNLIEAAGGRLPWFLYGGYKLS